MSKRRFKRLMQEKSAELRKWANERGLVFKTTSEIERERATREREQDRLKKQRNSGGRGNKLHKGKSKVKYA